MGIKEQVKLVKDSLTAYPEVKIVAATKYMSIDQARELVEAGINNLGENRTDMFLEKYNELKDYKINWHFFGVLQSRKVKDVVNKISCLHSLDRMSIALELDKKLTQPLDCFIQVNITEEPNKQGVAINKVKIFIKQLIVCKNINVIGLMCIAKMTPDQKIVREEFQKMKKLQLEIESMNLPYAPCHELSMGMSNDYKIAVEEGATTIRIGRIFIR